MISPLLHQTGPSWAIKISKPLMMVSIAASIVRKVACSPKLPHHRKIRPAAVCVCSLVIPLFYPSPLCCLFSFFLSSLLTLTALPTKHIYSTFTVCTTPAALDSFPHISERRHQNGAIICEQTPPFPWGHIEKNNGEKKHQRQWLT